MKCSAVHVIVQEILKSAKYMGGKSADWLIHSFQNCELLSPLCTIDLIGIKFLGNVNPTILFQYSEVIYL